MKVRENIVNYLETRPTRDKVVDLMAIGAVALLAKQFSDIADRRVKNKDREAK